MMNRMIASEAFLLELCVGTVTGVLLSCSGGVIGAPAADIEFSAFISELNSGDDEFVLLPVLVVGVELAPPEFGGSLRFTIGRIDRGGASGSPPSIGARTGPGHPPSIIGQT